VTGADFSGVDIDLLADYVGGALDGTPDETAVSTLIAEDAAWRDAYARLTEGVTAVTGELQRLGSVAEPMPVDVIARLDAALVDAADDRESGVTAGPAAMEPGTDGAAPGCELTACGPSTTTITARAPAVDPMGSRRAMFIWKATGGRLPAGWLWALFQTAHLPTLYPAYPAAAGVQLGTVAAARIVYTRSIRQQRNVGSSHTRTHSMTTTDGTIKRITDRGFGFIATAEGSEYFFHQSACVGTAFDELREGQAVSFTVGQGPKGPRAENVAVR